jgi:anti-anti-sigma regulatory factor
MLVAIVLGIVIAFALLLAYVRAVAWMKETQTTRFVLEDRDTYLFLKLDRPLGSDPSALVSMRALSEALRLRLAGVGHQRVLVDVSGLQVANSQAFGLLMGVLEPVLQDETVKVAVVCKRRTRARRFFEESGVLTPFPSVREGERYLRSVEARVPLDPEGLDSPVGPGRRNAA